MGVIEDVILKSTKAIALQRTEVIQELWSGYGEIVRYALKGGTSESVVVKQVKLPNRRTHPRGWNSTLSHSRKVKSYQVETAWYKYYNDKSYKYCRVPKCFGYDLVNGDVLLVLEDLDDAGYSVRKTSATLGDVKTCLSWLANFHATFMGQEPKELWEVGTYWHLDTRPDELIAMEDVTLKGIANKVDALLNNSPYLTFVHGDAKLANFCFSVDGNSVAVVDFQYVGGGCGMKDVAYLIGSCLDSSDCEEYEAVLLDWYFKQLRAALRLKGDLFDVDEIEEDWRRLFPVSWVDFYRFLKGWSPNHWKINDYGEQKVQEVINQLQ
jgi:hypothetical protein